MAKLPSAFESLRLTCPLILKGEPAERLRILEADLSYMSALPSLSSSPSSGVNSKASVLKTCAFRKTADAKFLDTPVHVYEVQPTVHEDSKAVCANTRNIGGNAPQQS